jgi:hypothetical protein
MNDRSGLLSYLIRDDHEAVHLPRREFVRAGIPTKRILMAELLARKNDSQKDIYCLDALRIFSP